MMPLLRQVTSLSNDVITGTNVEFPDAAITLTRTANVAITTAGYDVAWQSQIRGQGLTWSSGTPANITFNTPGYYLLQTQFSFSANTAGNSDLVVNNSAVLKLWEPVSNNRWVFSYTRYFNTSDFIRLRIFPSLNVTLNATAEGSTNESPILHIVQIARQTSP